MSISKHKLSIKWPYYLDLQHITDFINRHFYLNDAKKLNLRILNVKQ